MIKLRITHFYDPEPESGIVIGNPELKDHQIALGHTNAKGETFSKAHSAWKARQLEPSLADFNVKIMERYNQNDRNYRKALQHYVENRLRYEGFEELGSDSDAFVFNEICVLFFNDSSGVLVSTGVSGSIDLRFNNGLSVSLFEQICKENGIELKKI